MFPTSMASIFKTPAFPLLVLLLPLRRWAMAQEIHEANRPPQGDGILS